jgi:hypothetical protein
VRIEIIANHTPGRGWCRRGEQVLHEGNEIVFGAGIADHAANHASGDIERGDQGFRAVPDILELTPLDVPWLHGQAFRGALQGLDPSHLVDRNGLGALFRRRGRRLIDIADASTLRVEVRVRFGGQPVPNTMRFKIRFFLKSAQPSRARCFRRCRVGPPGGPVRSGSND